MPAATILHAALDAFFAAVEQRDNPELQGRPVIVGGDPGERGVVTSPSYEARRFGVHSAMPSATAQRLCPEAVFVRPRHVEYSAVSDRIMNILRSMTPLVEPLSLDEAFLDVAGCERSLGTPVEIARTIKILVLREEELTISIGIAASKSVAKIASDLCKPDGLLVVPAGTERQFLAPLPVGNVWGVGPKTARNAQGHRDQNDRRSRGSDSVGPQRKIRPERPSNSPSRSGDRRTVDRTRPPT